MGRVVTAQLLVVLCLFGIISAEGGKHGGHHGGHEKHKKLEAPPLTIKGQGPSTYTCPVGFQQLGFGELTSCLQEIITPAMPFCPIGKPLGDKCAVYEPVLYHCPPGYYPSGGKKDGNHHGGHHGGHSGKKSSVTECVRVDQAPFENYCPNGLPVTPEGCAGVQTSPVWSVCPLSGGKKHKHHEGDCLDYKVVPGVFTCKLGFVLEGAMCVGVQAGPCPLPEKGIAEPVCAGHGCMGKDFVMRRRLGKHDKHKKDDYAPMHKLPPLCDLPIQIPAYEVCPPGSIETASTKKHGSGGLNCAVGVPVPLEAYCPIPNGIIDPSGHICTAQFFEAPLLKCPIGYSDCSKKHKHHGGGGCCRVDYAPPLVGCARGFEMAGPQCIAYHPMDWMCEPNAVLQGYDCFAQITAPPKIIYTVEVATKGAILPPPPLPLKRPPPPQKAPFFPPAKASGFPGPHPPLPVQGIAETDTLNLGLVEPVNTIP